MDKLNAASRLHDILQKARAYSDGTRSLDVWSDTFGIPKTDSVNRSIEVALAISLAHGELQIIQLQLQELNRPARLYSAEFQKIEKALASVENLNAPWQHSKPQLGDDVFTALLWCNDALPEEEVLIPQKERDELLKEVIELESAIQVADLPQDLRELALRHISLIKRALWAYSIRGARGLREALHQSVGEIVVDGKRTDAQPPEMAQLGKLWRKVRDMTNSSLKIYGGARLAHDGYQQVRQLIEEFFKIVP